MSKKLIYTCLVLLLLGTNNIVAQTISAGGDQSFSICNSGGTVKSVGKNTYGQLGDGSNTERNTPVSVSGLSNITKVVAGDQHTLLLKSDSTAWAVGSNSFGKLGDGTTTSKNIPVIVSSLPKVIDIACNSSHSLFLRDDNTVWASGYNGSGELGDGTIISRSTPVQVNISGIIAISAGSSHSLFLKNDGTVWAVGNNFFGQLGDGTNTNRLIPVRVNGLVGVVAIAAGYGHSLFLKNNGTVWAVGRNASGELGDGTLINRNLPVQVNVPIMISAIATSNEHSLFLRNDSTVWAVGANQHSQLGDGTVTTIGCACKTTPVQVSNLGGVTSIAAGGRHSVFLKNDSTVWALGYNFNGQLGDGSTSTTGCLCKNSIVQTVNSCLVKQQTIVNFFKGIYGEVYNDINQNCTNENENLLPGRKLIINPGNIIVETIGNGYWYIDSLPAGNYTITADTSGKWRRTCPLAQSFTITNPDTFYMAPGFGFVSTEPCTEPEVSVTMPRMRPGFSNQNIYLQVCNEYKATGALTNGYIELELDPMIIPQSASVSYTSLGGNKYKFILSNDTLNPGQCENITVSCSLSNIAVVNSTLCIKANLFPADSCVFDTIPNTVTGVTPCTLPWDKSSLKVTGTCTGDSIRFVVYNHGSGSMQCYAPVRIYVDGVLITLDSIMLTSGDSAVYVFLGDGRTWRLEADQHPLHPGRSHPNATVENCGSGTWTPNLVNVLPQDDADPVVDVFCGVVIGSFDPNDKTGYPLGINSTHDVMPNQQMEYVIRFQNTGTDTAFTVVIRDTLDTDLDIFSVVSGVSSHKYKFRMYGPRVLEWTFSSILLPDSNVNEAGSHGFVTFTVEQNRNLANGTEISNTAGINFDFNAPVITNTTVHTVNEGVQSVVNSQKLVGNKQSAVGKLKVYPNPADSELAVSSPKLAVGSVVEIWNVVGVKMLEVRAKKLDSSIPQSDSSVVVDIADLPRGMYVVKVGAEAVKLVVE